jgi:pyruvate dehydrogenase E2 component (dihydrolipoyllysine-residue acetyltransferase)
VLQEVRMPALGQTTDELRIISWLKKEGDPVEQGEPLFEVETDKATLEVEAFSSGILRKILRQEDEVVEVGTLVAYIGKAEDEHDGAGSAVSSGRARYFHYALYLDKYLHHCAARQ